MEDLKWGSPQSSLKTAQMDIPAINACAAYSYGFSSAHRQLAKAKAQREGRLEVTETDVQATAIEACKLYLTQLEAQTVTSKNSQPRNSQPKKSQSSQSPTVENYQA